MKRKVDECECKPLVTGTLGFKYANGPIKLAGEVRLNWPCVGGGELMSGRLSATVDTDMLKIDGAVVDVAYDCTNRSMSVEGTVKSAKVGPAVRGAP